MATLENYKGLQVLDSASGTGGQAISDDFRDLVDWHPQSVWDKTADPGSSDDGSGISGKNYQVGSLWLNTTTHKLFLCTSNGTGTATWLLLPLSFVATPTLNSNIDAGGFSISDAGTITATSFVGSGVGLTGVVTSVGLTAPSIMSVSGSPVTGSGSFTLTLAAQSAHAVFCGPSSGSAVAPTFRGLVAADIPTSLPLTTINPVGNLGVTCSNFSVNTGGVIGLYGEFLEFIDANGNVIVTDVSGNMTIIVAYDLNLYVSDSIYCEVSQDISISTDNGDIDLEAANNFSIYAPGSVSLQGENGLTITGNNDDLTLTSDHEITFNTTSGTVTINDAGGIEAANANFGSTITPVIITGSITPNLIGTYVVAGTYNGMNYYQCSGVGYIWWLPTFSVWILSASLGVQTNDFYTGGATEPAASTWVNQNGATGTPTSTYGTSQSAIIDGSGNITTPNKTKTGSLIVSTSTTPASASAIGTAGTITWDSSYIYVCTATNTWKRMEISTW